MVGLNILKHRFNVSDEVVVKGLHENLHWMVFCGVKLQARHLRVGEGRVELRPCCFLESSTMRTTIAGFEMGSGIYINTVLPEETTSLMKETARSLPEGECPTLK